MRNIKRYLKIVTIDWESSVDWESSLEAIPNLESIKCIVTLFLLSSVLLFIPMIYM